MSTELDEDLLSMVKDCAERVSAYQARLERAEAVLVNNSVALRGAKEDCAAQCAALREALAASDARASSLSAELASVAERGAAGDTRLAFKVAQCERGLDHLGEDAQRAKASVDDVAYDVAKHDARVKELADELMRHEARLAVMAESAGAAGLADHAERLAVVEAYMRDDLDDWNKGMARLEEVFSLYTGVLFAHEQLMSRVDGIERLDRESRRVDGIERLDRESRRVDVLGMRADETTASIAKLAQRADEHAHAMRTHVNTVVTLKNRCDELCTMINAKSAQRGSQQETMQRCINEHAIAINTNDYARIADFHAQRAATTALRETVETLQVRSKDQAGFVEDQQMLLVAQKDAIAALEKRISDACAENTARSDALFADVRALQVRSDMQHDRVNPAFLRRFDAADRTHSSIEWVWVCAISVFLVAGCCLEHQMMTATLVESMHASMQASVAGLEAAAQTNITALGAAMQLKLAGLEAEHGKLEAAVVTIAGTAFVGAVLSAVLCGHEIFVLVVRACRS